MSDTLTKINICFRLGGESIAEIVRIFEPVKKRWAIKTAHNGDKLVGRKLVRPEWCPGFQKNVLTPNSLVPPYFHIVTYGTLKV